MQYVGLVRNVMLGREGLHRDVLLRLVDAAGGRAATSHLRTGNLPFDTTYLLPRPWRDEATTRSWSTVQRLASVRTTSIGSMPSSAGRSKPHTCA